MKLSVCGVLAAVMCAVCVGCSSDDDAGQGRGGSAGASGSAGSDGSGSAGQGGAGSGGSIGAAGTSARGSAGSGSAGSAPGSGGSAGSISDPDPDRAMCGDYCEIYLLVCKMDPSFAFADAASCSEACANYRSVPGSDPMQGDTLQCRLHQADLIRDGLYPSERCPPAGPQPRSPCVGEPRDK